ncbi:hypothetical protein WR25_22624 [Diploscapter pachys]|uniref:SGS domain-containing protein n=1 Tax=Diploscapter pachys TaxID=2018661 RepID=A0A2A2LRG2_9BILA|nr:hypothetical protein WR25_22624 [Diploscapter pachys]
MSEAYSFSLTTFSPSGKLMQIEYALNAVKNGQPSVGLRAKDGVVLATENSASVFGMGPDFRLLVKKARKLAMEYELMYGEEIPTVQLVSKVAAVMQEYTQSGGVRPFGVSLLIAGWDKYNDKPLLFQSDPSGAYFAWKATALGKNDVNAKTFLEKRYSDSLELDDGIHTALLTLRESFDVAMTEENVEGQIVFEETLSNDIDKDNLTVKCTNAKIEIRLPKKAHVRWERFVEQKAESSKKVEKKNWDKLEKEMEKEEEDEQLEGDAAVSKLFKKIYAGASDDVKKAMLKSYTESNGTVLSTNWEEIAKKTTETKPPDCMEFKKYEQ